MTVAVKNKYQNWYCKQIVVHGVHSKTCFVNDVIYFFLGGYVVGWYAERLTKYPKWYEDERWGEADDKYFDMYAPIVNREYLKKYPEYQYSAWELYDSSAILQYLRLYEQYPQVEYLMKAGLGRLHSSLTILKRIGKDKRFYKWLMANRTELAENYFYKDVIIRAYTSGKPLSVLQNEKQLKIKFARDDSYRALKRRYSDDIIKRMIQYLSEKSIGISLYKDYIEACEKLKLDMTLEKNLFPHDFMRWHDIRMDEYTTAKALADEQEHKALYEKFAFVAEKYMDLQHNKKFAYMVIIARSPMELINEGTALNHCIGKYGYDQKFAREESLIFFLQTKEQPVVPFITIEYYLQQHKILQCYGTGNTKPSTEVDEFIHKKWLPYANRTLKN